MLSENFMRDFFGLRQSDRSPKRYEWITVQARPEITANQHPNYYSSLCSMWVADGWEIMSVTPFPPSSNIDMCKAVVVLRRAVSENDG